MSLNLVPRPLIITKLQSVNAFIAMSRRIDPDKGGKRGRGGRYGGGGGGRLQDRYDGPRNESPQPVGVPPAVPNFGFNFNMPGGMPPFQ